MKLLKLFNRENVSEDERNSFEHQKSARTIVLDRSNKIALLYSKKDDYYVLPGGRVEENEDIKDCTIRESKEETGCDVKIIKEIGRTIELRKKKKILKDSYCYAVKVMGKKGIPCFEEGELEDDFIVIWFDLEEAKKRIKSNKISNNLYYNYITERDLLFLEQL